MVNNDTNPELPQMTHLEQIMRRALARLFVEHFGQVAANVEFAFTEEEEIIATFDGQTWTHEIGSDDDWSFCFTRDDEFFNCQFNDAEQDEANEAAGEE